MISGSRLTKEIFSFFPKSKLFGAQYLSRKYAQLRAFFFGASPSNGTNNPVWFEFCEVRITFLWESATIYGRINIYARAFMPILKTAIALINSQFRPQKRTKKSKLFSEKRIISRLSPARNWRISQTSGRIQSRKWARRQSTRSILSLLLLPTDFLACLNNSKVSRLLSNRRILKSWKSTENFSKIINSSFFLNFIILCNFLESEIVLKLPISISALSNS